MPGIGLRAEAVQHYFDETPSQRALQRAAATSAEEEAGDGVQVVTPDSEQAVCGATPSSRPWPRAFGLMTISSRCHVLP